MTWGKGGSEPVGGRRGRIGFRLVAGGPYAVRQRGELGLAVRTAH